jgi:hypothetical protein
MENILYSKLIKGADEVESGEATILYITQEVNGVACIIQSPEEGTVIVRSWPNHAKNEAIEFGVAKAAAEINQFRAAAHVNKSNGIPIR